jgi:hypothetical protein
MQLPESLTLGTVFRVAVLILVPVVLAVVALLAK